MEGIGTDGVILTGFVSSQAEAQQAFDIAVRLVNSGSSDVVGNGNKVVNAIVVRNRDQIMLKVTVAEVERDLIKQLGINFSGTANVGSAVINFNNTNPFTAYGQSLSGSSIAATTKSITGTLQAMEQAGVIHTLAEPNLTAISGETATFVAGGEFPHSQRLFLLRDVDDTGRTDNLSALDRIQEIWRKFSTSRQSC